MDLPLHTGNDSSVSTVGFLANVYQRRQRQFNHPWRSWPRFFWGFTRFNLNWLLRKRRTITGYYGADLLGRFDTQWIKRSYLVKKKVLFHNFPAHSSAIATAKLLTWESRYELLLYSPDLAADDIVSFPNMKKQFRRDWFMGNDKVISETNLQSLRNLIFLMT